MYAFTPGQSLCLVYEDFYLAIGYTFYEFINPDGVIKKSTYFVMVFEDFYLITGNNFF
jgi:hypothetical protein